MEYKSKVGRKLVLAATFIAFSALGGLIKIPSPVGSIALDSTPGYFLAAYIDPITGGVVGMFGHLASSATGGFTLGFVHIAIALQMFLWCLAFGIIARAINKLIGLVVAGIVGTFLNGIVGPLMLGAIGMVPMALARGIIVILTLASVLNIAIASLAIFLIGKRTK
jgi:hypothetical protein